LELRFSKILVIVEESTFPGRHLRARPIGALMMTDRKVEDEKILAVPYDDPRFANIIDLSQLQEHWPREIATFFHTYKELQGEQTDVRDWFGADEAWG
jgi:inorganic pyrophosphatase